mgnify:CR=1 FL=1
MRGAKGRAKHLSLEVNNLKSRAVAAAEKILASQGVEDLNRSANEHMPDDDRPIPFSQMIYFGDGDTDVPSFTVTRKNGGHAVAVFKPGEASTKCRMLFDKHRVDYYAPANYAANSDLERGVKLILDKIAAGILLDMEIANLKP